MFSTSLGMLNAKLNIYTIFYLEYLFSLGYQSFPIPGQLGFLSLCINNYCNKINMILFKYLYSNHNYPLNTTIYYKYYVISKSSSIQ